MPASICDVCVCMCPVTCFVQIQRVQRVSERVSDASSVCLKHSGCSDRLFACYYILHAGPLHHEPPLQLRVVISSTLV